MQRHLCIHGHFYQPPREDPWLLDILPEGSAAPMRHWNERILRESYAPLSCARRLDGHGRITQLVNAYEWMSFNFGPTLLSWLERADPATYARVVEGDRKSCARLGHGNAISQVYHHIIMPLASALDKEAEVAWAVADFKARYGRPPEGMWLAETAADVASLETLAAYGVKFTILAPRQAKQLSPLGKDEWRDAQEHEVDITQPYRIELPSGRSIAAFFYNGPISQAVAFERLLEDGERFWQRLSASCVSNGLLSVATDGETYGHHFRFGEMALAYALGQTFFGRDEIQLTNFAAYLADNPPAMRVRIHEPSSWSCVHGVGRWERDCGCTTGGHPGWRQAWRAPLRQGLNAVKQALDAHYFAAGAALFRDPRQALLDFGAVLARDPESGDPASFAKRAFKAKLGKAQARTAWKLLAMQQWALASFASCAWFFDEISRLEPMNGLTFCLRAMELAKETCGPDCEPMLRQSLAQARSNIPEKGTGADLFHNEVKPRLETEATLAAQALVTLWAEGRLPDVEAEAPAVVWPGVTLSLNSVEEPESFFEEGRLRGRASVAWRHESGEDALDFDWLLPDRDAMRSQVLVKLRAPKSDCVPTAETSASVALLPWNKRQALADAVIGGLEAADWREALEAAQEALPLFQDWQEAQVTQTSAERWVRFWAAMAWDYVMGVGAAAQLAPRQRASLVAFLREQGANHPEKSRLGERVARETLRLMNSTPPLWTAAEGVAAKAADLGLDVDWWAAQNRLWELGWETPQARGLAALLGFAV